MHIVVLLKQVLDPEIPQTAFAVDPRRRAPAVERAPYVLSVFDGNALELALGLRAALGEGTITALSLGPKGAEDVLRKALALTADAATLIQGDASSLDSGQKALVLAAAIRRLGQVDLVLAGRQAADWEAGQVGGMVAEALFVPCVPFVARVAPAEGGLEVRQQLESGHAVLKVQLPAVLTVTNDDRNVLRPAKVKDVMASRGRPVGVLALSEMAAEAGIFAPPSVEVTDLGLPPVRAHAEMVDGATPAERAKGLARRLGEIGAI